MNDVLLTPHECLRRVALAVAAARTVADVAHRLAGVWQSPASREVWARAALASRRCAVAAEQASQTALGALTLPQLAWAMVEVERAAHAAGSAVDMARKKATLLGEHDAPHDTADAS